jgi:hypothetical protein
MAKRGNKGHNYRSKGLHMGRITKTNGYRYIVHRVASCAAFYDHTITNTYLVVYSFPLALCIRFILVPAAHFFSAIHLLSRCVFISAGVVYSF